MFGRRSFLVGASAAVATATIACGADQAKAPQPQRKRPFKDLYQCEGCDGAFERPSADLTPHFQIASANEPGERMRIEGVVLQSDGTTPAEGVIVYAYHTDAKGLYSRGTPETEWSRRHGLLRGWVKTGKDGKYSFDTIKPAPYPNATMPAHVHLTVLEPGTRPYWIDDIVFDGEFGVTPQYRRERENRGGDGIVKLKREGGRWVARRDIILEPHPQS